MKKVTMILPDRHGLNLAKLMDVAIEFHVEHVQELFPEVGVVPRGFETVVGEATGGQVKPNGKLSRKREKGRTLQQTILNKARHQRNFTRKVARLWLVNAGYSPNSTDPTLSRMVRNKQIVKLDNQTFRLP